MMSYTCAHVCMCMCVGGSLSPPPTHIHPPPHPPGGTPGISQNSIALELIEIFQFCLKIWNLWRLPHPWVGVLLGGWVGWWVGSGQNTKNLKNNRDNSILFEDLWFVETPPPTPLPMGGWMGGSMGGVRSNDLKFNQSWPNWDNSILFEDLWFVETPPPTPHPWVGGGVGGWVGQWVNEWG